MTALRIDPIPHNAYLARFLIDEVNYDHMTVVCVMEEGRVLYLMGLTSKDENDIPSLDMWKAAAAKYFPDAEIVRFKRWNPRTHQFRDVSLPIGRRFSKRPCEDVSKNCDESKNSG